MNILSDPINKTSAFFATCPKGIEALLYQELIDLGIQKAKETVAGVHFDCDLATAYRVCLWSRLANRVLMPLSHFQANSTDSLYDGVRAMVNWHDHVEPSGSFAVTFTGTRSNDFHSHYAALRVKDAVVDQFNERFGMRPSIDTLLPDIRLNVYMKHHDAIVSLDFTGDSLHRRGYRTEGGAAPVKENLAAAILIRSGWPDLVHQRVPLVDPMCGSGTLLIEAAMMAFDMAPGLLRQYFGFIKWKQHDQLIWNQLLFEAREKAQQGMTNQGAPILGFDKDPEMIRLARSNASRAGLLKFIQFERQDVKALQSVRTSMPGLVVSNPPYGRRLGEKKALESLYRFLGDRLKKGFLGWQASIFTANPDLAKNMGIRAKKQYRLYNGALACRLLNFDIAESWFMQPVTPGRLLSSVPKKNQFADAGSEMFANRIKKNLKNIGKWARRQGITCYRLYDADMPEYSVAIDIYDSWVHVQEYQAPPGVVPENARRRLNQIKSVLPDILETEPEKIILKIRKKTRGDEQYEKLGSFGRFFEVQENGLRFFVNLMDYLDTGLFLDHRITRQMIKNYSFEKRVLNLFCYTGTASVYAAAGGARKTTSVDMSRAYVSWAEKNLALNGFKGNNHKLVQADCLEWIPRCRDQYDLIFLDPPTFSNSKRMNTSFDIQKDHPALIIQTLRLLSPGGLLIFSCNRKKFIINENELKGRDVKDITRTTIPKDFERKKGVHHCFEIH